MVHKEMHAPTTSTNPEATIEPDATVERDAAVERWLREEVAPVYDAMQADPGRGLSADQVTAALAAHHAARLKKAGRGA